MDIEDATMSRSTGFSISASRSTAVPDGVDAFDRAADGVGVADVAVDQLDVLVEVPRPLAVAPARACACATAAVDLRAQEVERADLVVVSEQFVGEVRADESRATG